MFDIGFTELMVIGVVALIVVGPKDLPTLFRTLGRITARLRALGREFTQAMNAAADQSGMAEVAKDLKGMTNPGSYGLDKLNEAVDKFENWSPSTPEPKKPDTTDPQRRADVEKIRAMSEAKGREKLARERAGAEAAKAAGEASAGEARSASASAETAPTAPPKPAEPQPGAAASAAETKTDDA